MIDCFWMITSSGLSGSIGMASPLPDYVPIPIALTTSFVVNLARSIASLFGTDLPLLGRIGANQFLEPGDIRTLPLGVRDDVRCCLLEGFPCLLRGSVGYRVLLEGLERHPFQFGRQR